MDGKTRAPVLSYALLLAGTAALLLLFAVRSRIWEFIDPFPRVFLFLLWLAAPPALLAFNTFAVSRWLCEGEEGDMFLTGTLLFLASGALIYSRAAILPPGEVMEINLVFLMGPLPHFAAAILVTAGYLFQTVRRMSSRRKGGTPGTGP